MCADCNNDRQGLSSIGWIGRQGLSSVGWIGCDNDR